MRHSRKWSALIIGLIITVLLSILVIGFMEKVMRVGYNIKSIEQSTQAYYLASGIIETQLHKNNDLKTKPWNTTEINTPNLRWYFGSSLQVHSRSNTIPSTRKWNSPFDNNYNIISVDRPVQLVIPNGINWNTVKFDFRVPNTDGDSNTQEKVHDIYNKDIIFWTLGNNKFAFFPNTEWVDKGLLNKGNFSDVSLWDKKWYYFLQNGTKESNKTLDNFYKNLNTLWSNGAECSDDYKCTLKLSMLEPITIDVNGKKVENFPLLEYKITWLNVPIPEQYMTLDASGYVGNYIRKRSVQIPQITTNTALDFAVLQ